MIAWDMRLTLEAGGFEVCGIVSSGTAAVHEANAAEPDVILMDVNLREEMDGVEAARAILARRPGTRIVFVTGFGDPATAARIRTLDPAGYLLKPVMAEELTAAVIRAIEGRARDD